MKRVSHGARRPRAVHRVRRRRPRARGQGRGDGEVPQHRAGVHLPQPACSCSAASPSRSSPRMEERFAKLQAGSGFTDGVTVGPLIDDAALAKMERQVADAVDKGARRRHRWRPPHRRRPRRRLLLRTDAARRRHARHAHLPRGDVRADRAGHRVRRRRRGDRDGQRHRLRPGVVRLHAATQPGVPRHRAPAVRHGRRQRHQPDVGRRAVRRGEGVGPRPSRAPARASTSTSTPSSSASRCKAPTAPRRSP